ncbi:MAG TPA: MATE family efflux transporter [Gammaproteobacteria bacterium]
MSPRTRHRPSAADLADLLKLAAPIVLIQVGMMLMGVVDTIMVGRLSAVALAAVALANLYSFGIMIFGLGVLLGLDPIVSQALGARDEEAVGRALQRGLVLSAVLTVPISLLLTTVEPVLTLAGQPPEVVPLAAGYVYRVLPGVWPFYAFVVLRQTLQAHRRTAPIVVTIVAANVVNAALNYVLIFGHFGFPELGVLGSAWATCISRWVMALQLLALGGRHLSAHLRRVAPHVLDPKPLGRMLWIGAPIGAQMMLEFGAFAAVALLMGRLGVVEVAAHQVAINLASLTFMVPLGVSSAAAVIIGHAVGRQDAPGVRRAMLAALLVGAAFMSLTAALFIGAPGRLAALYTSDAAVLALAAVLLPIAGVFQIFDGLQVVSLGLLRGLGDTRVPMIVNVVGFWCCGIPASLVLGFGVDLGAVGLWWGLVLGLAAVAAILVLRLRHRASRELVRVVIDDRPVPAAQAGRARSHPQRGARLETTGASASAGASAPIEQVDVAQPALVENEVSAELPRRAVVGPIFDRGRADDVCGAEHAAGSDRHRRDLP